MVKKTPPEREEPKNLRDRCISYLREIETRAKEGHTLAVNERDYSCAELIAEVEQQTELGVQLMKLFAQFENTNEVKSYAVPELSHRPLLLTNLLDGIAKNEDQALPKNLRDRCVIYLSRLNATTSDDCQFSVGQKYYNCAGLTQQIEQQTKLGLRLIKLFEHLEATNEVEKAIDLIPKRPGLLDWLLTKTQHPEINPAEKLLVE